MFVLQSTFDKMQKRASIAESAYWTTKARHDNLLTQWNDLVDRINKKGGEAFLKRAKIPTGCEFEPEDVQRLIQLCHPDRHDGKPLATEMTQKLVALKQKLEAK